MLLQTLVECFAAYQCCHFQMQRLTFEVEPATLYSFVLLTIFSNGIYSFLFIIQSFFGLYPLAGVFFTIVFFFIFYFIYFWLCWVFGSCEGFLWLRQVWATLHRGVGTALHRGARAFHYRGPSRCGAQAPDAQAR